MKYPSQLFYGLFYFFFALTIACDENEISSSDLVDESGFDHPQAVVFMGSDLVVGNTGYRPRNWADGFLTVIDLEQRIIRQKLQTSAQNPQNLIYEDPWLMAVETGVFDFSDFDAPKSVAPFGIELFTKTQDGLSSTGFIELPDHINGKEISAPIAMATLNSTSLVTSGLFNILWRIKWTDFSAAEVDEINVLKLDDELQPGLGAITVWKDHFVVTNFNTDTVYLLDGNGAEIRCAQFLGQSRDMIEGLQTPLVIDDQLYMTKAFSGDIVVLNLNEFEQSCNAGMMTLPIILGQVPNDLDLVGNELWFTVSGENHLLRIDKDSDEELTKVILPVGSNPWHFSFNAELELGAVTLWQKQTVQIVNQFGQLEFEIKN